MLQNFRQFENTMSIEMITDKIKIYKFSLFGPQLCCNVRGKEKRGKIKIKKV